MSDPSRNPYGPASLASAIRAAVEKVEPQRRLYRRDVLKLGEEHIVKRGVPPQAKSAEDRDTFVFDRGVA